ncbi:MAG: ribonuclease HI family protein [Deltaproteobacteria bacterium]|jgi:ribonuclease HI|nr:ribonuclease HI family protein [Deltaproteobacteria bacterium]
MTTTSELCEPAPTKINFWELLDLIKEKTVPLANLSPSRYRLNSDGAAKRNPGPAAAGIVIYDPFEVQLGGWAWYLGPLTNNAAEYSALLLGLTKAFGLGIKKLLVQMDSELVARQMLGQYRVRHPGILPYYEKAKELAAGFEEIVFSHVYRERNGHADRLASEAADYGQRGLLGINGELDKKDTPLFLRG